MRRRLISRAEVQKYLEDKFNQDQSAKRLERDEIVLKKLGLLDRDFNLKPFLIGLLKEQIEAFYDPKTKTVNLLDWVDADEQKPVLAHELTHALQDQAVNLDRWDNRTPENISSTASSDIDHLQKDEMDAARDAVVEGQATAAMTDYVLKPLSIRCDNGPELTSRHFLAWAIERKIELVHIQPGKPTQNAYVESFHGRLREECLRVSWFENLFDARRKIASWRHDYNHQRPHSSLNYRPPAEFADLTSYGKDAGAARFENAPGVFNFPTASTAAG